MTIKKLFPTLIYFDDLLDNKKKLQKFCLDLKKDCLKLKDNDDEGQEWSAENFCEGYTSYNSLPNLHEVSTGFQSLKKEIDRHVLKYAQALDYDLEDANLEMVSSWVNIVGPKCYHGLHLHPLSTISGTVYIDVPKGSGSLKLEDPRLSKMMASPPRLENARIDNQHFMYFKPSIGKIILFESWLRHEVEQNTGRDERISISFNYHW